jgi:hypothetical protein
MGLFNRKKKDIVPPLVVAPPADSRVEVELHKGATAEAAQKAKEANAHLTDLLAANGFTLKIYLAAGGQLHQKKQGGHK